DPITGQPIAIPEGATGTGVGPGAMGMPPRGMGGMGGMGGMSGRGMGGGMGMGRPPMGGRGMGGEGMYGPRGMGGEGFGGLQSTAPEVPYKLYRYVDTSCEPGKRYRYRVRLWVNNPNYGFPAGYLEDPES